MAKKILPLIIFVFIDLIIVFFVNLFFKPYSNNLNSNHKIYWISSDRIISSVELNSDLIEWNEFAGKRISVKDSYAYAKIEFDNTNSDKASTFFILNKDSNSNNILMTYQKFQMFYVSDYHSFNKEVYRISIPPHSEKTYFIEMQNIELISVNPVIIGENSLLSQLLKDQLFLWLILINTGLFSFYLLAEYFIFKNRFLFFASIMSIFIDIFYLFQSGIMFAIFPERFTFLVQEKIIYPTFYIIFLVLFLLSSVQFFRHISNGTILWFTSYISFVPWFTFNTIDSVAKLFGFRIFFEQIVPLSYYISLISFGIFIVRAYDITQKSNQEELLSYFTLNSKISFSDIIKEKNIPTQLLIKIRDKLQQPLEIVRSVSLMMADNTDRIKNVAYASVISDYILEMKKILGLEMFSVNDELVKSKKDFNLINELDFEEFSEFKDATICIYGKDDEISFSTKIILASEGIYCAITDSVEQIFAGIESGNYQMLIIDPAGDEGKSFEVCKKIRDNYNLLQFPILMIINFYTNYLVRTGYSVGVNDFVIRPFDSSELVSRCFSLLQIKNMFLHNQELARQENEKSTFLYFVTHNVNTPLTLLLNRIEEFAVYEKNMNKEQLVIFSDIREAINEINDIIQNVLISFRISDGKFVNVKEKIFIEDVLDVIRPTMETKANMQNVKLIWNIQELLPQVYCNFQAARGIITNIIDNAIKYSPERGKVLIQLKLMKNEKYMVLSISDEGEGVPKNKIPYLFSKFEKINNDSKQNRPSVGLGLYVANELAKINDIQLHYSTASTGGACFSVIFKVSEKIN